ncbi:MAG TPA: transposase [Bacteroidales bacterium]|nr:transposase [Bacteroidales bacterium]HOU97139.1 transposase [Bacteroidales bacterium]HQG37064.1 transposase [Bacteroidales bacterium]HQG52147.1 transposase [Bacteroidales bacterium]HQJ19933.1 transposase [Bacteroidales bacterium]
MKYNPDNHHRRSIRLQGYDYSQPGIYFITLCTHNRECLFGKILNGEMRLNEFGKMTQQCWLEIPNHFPHVQLDEYIIMPNHIHGIIVLNDIIGVQNIEPQRQNAYQHIIPGSIGSIIRGFKIGVTKGFKILKPDNTDIYVVWQRNFYEHIIRNNDELNRIRKYIIDNPKKWKTDEIYI